MPAPKLAYELRHIDGNNEPCAVVYAGCARGARRQYTIFGNAEFRGVEAERKPEFDVYLATGGPTTTDLFTKHGWRFGCADCDAELVGHEEDPEAVVVSERRHHGSVRCGACVAKQRTSAVDVAAYAARHLGCEEIEDVPDALKRVLGEHFDAETHRRVLESQRDKTTARAEAAENMVRFLKEREDGFALALSVTDGGRYRADWPSAMKRYIAEHGAHRQRADEAEAECARLRAAVDQYALIEHEHHEERDAARAEAAALRAVAEAADLLVFRDYHAEIESYAETLPGSHDATRIAAQATYDDLVAAVDAMREATRASVTTGAAAEGTAE